MIKDDEFMFLKLIHPPNRKIIQKYRKRQLLLYNVIWKLKAAFRIVVLFEDPIENIALTYFNIYR